MREKTNYLLYLIFALLLLSCGGNKSEGLSEAGDTLRLRHARNLTIVTYADRTLLPAIMLIGANLTLVCNLLSTLPRDRSIIPISVITPTSVPPSSCMLY